RRMPDSLRILAVMLESDRDRGVAIRFGGAIDRIGHMRPGVAIPFDPAFPFVADSDSDKCRSEEGMLGYRPVLVKLALDSGLDLESAFADHCAAVRDPRSVRIDQIRLFHGLRLLLRGLWWRLRLSGNGGNRNGEYQTESQAGSHGI